MKIERNYSAMDASAIAKADTSDWIAVLPLGAHEQHGPHLPFETDTIIATGIAERLAQAVDAASPVTFLPVEPIGYSVEHMDFEGSRTLTWDEAIQRWLGIGEALAAQGIRKMLILNAHGGNSPLMTVVATELRIRCAMLCVVTSWTRFITPGSIVSGDEKAFGIHGGEIETSVMLALAPDLVKMENAKNFDSFQVELVRDAIHLRAYGPHAFGWKMKDLNKQGVTGDASRATAETGEKLLSQAITGLCELIDDMEAFDMAHLTG